MLMKKIFSLFVAVITAMTFNAAELTINLANAEGYTHKDDGSGVPALGTDGVLTVTWTVGTAWDVAGVEIPLDSLTGITNVSFEYKGDAGATSLLVYLRDSEGNRWWDGDNGSIGSNVTEWTAVANTPGAKLWDGPTYAYGERPFVKLGIVANPSAPANGAFYLRNLKITDDSLDPRPTTAPATPEHAEEDVMAVYCNHYPTNNLNFNVLGWGGVQTWETLTLGEDSTKILACQDMKWEIMTNWDTSHYDMSAYKYLHFDVWAPQASIIKLTYEALGAGDGGSGNKQGVTFKLNQGWNTIDAHTEWWIANDSSVYDWKDMRYIIFEAYQKADSTSAEGTPFAFTNIYFWNEPVVVCPDAPADPALAEDKVTALFAKKYQTNTVAFTPQAWGGENWVSPAGYEGAYFYTPAFSWDAFTNWGADHYNMTEYDMFSFDIWVEVASNIKVTFEALSTGDGGSGWKNGAVVEGLQANQWNHVDVDLLNAPYDGYDFTDMRYLVLEGFTNEGTPLGITNAYFWNSMDQGVENVDADKTAVKRLIDGRLVIEKNGKRYNALGTEF